MSARCWMSILLALIPLFACETLPENAHGRERWRRMLRPRAMSTAPDGDILATTYERELIRIDPGGVDRWTRQFEYDVGLADISATGELLVGGRDNELGSNPPLKMERLGDDGEPRWSTLVATTGYETYLIGVVAAPELTFILPMFVQVETDDPNPPSTAHLWVYDVDGSLLRQDAFPVLTTSDYSVEKYPDGGFVLFVRAPPDGTDFGFGPVGPDDAVFVRFDPAGVAVEQHVRAEFLLHQLFAIGNDGGFYLTSTAPGELLVKTDSTGAVDWRTAADGSGFAAVQALAVDDDVVYLAGSVHDGPISFTPQGGKADEIIIPADQRYVASFDGATGALLWARSLDGQLDDPFAADAARGPYLIEFTPGEALDSSLVARSN